MLSISMQYTLYIDTHYNSQGDFTILGQGALQINKLKKQPLQHRLKNNSLKNIQRVLNTTTNGALEVIRKVGLQHSHPAPLGVR